MLKKRDKRHDFYYFLALLDNVSLKRVLSFFSFSELIYFYRKLQKINFSELKEVEIQEQVLIEFNHLALEIPQTIQLQKEGATSYDKEIYNLISQILSQRKNFLNDSFLLREREILIRKIISKLHSKFDKKQFLEDFGLLIKEEEGLNFDQRLRKEFYQRILKAIQNLPKKTEVILRIILKKYSKFY